MREYLLLKLIETAEQIDSRKRLQKSAFLLQARGCPLREHFIWHHYGPYSHGLASLLERMVASGFVEEAVEDLPGGRRYRYQLTEDGCAALRSYELTPEGKQTLKELEGAFECLRQFVKASFPLQVLELASSILYWQQRGRDLDEALDTVSKAKRVRRDLSQFKRARDIAAEFQVATGTA